MKYLDSKQQYYYSDSGNLCYRRNQDGHGGNAEEHRREMAQIADQIVQQRIADIIPDIQRAATENAYSNLLKALSFDVTSAVNIGFENAETIFRDSKTQKVVADAIMREIRKQLEGIK